MHTGTPQEREPADPSNRSGKERDHPLDEAQKSYRTVLEQQVTEATEELKRPAAGLLLSSLSAGMDLGFGPLLMAVALTLVGETWSHQASQILVANAYAVGFIFVVIGRSTLFTERTMSAVLPVLDGKARLAELFRLWGMALVGNLVGAALMAAIIALLGPLLGVVRVSALAEIAEKLIRQPGWVMLLSAVLAGWLMGLMTWLVTAARDTTGQILAVWMTAFVLGLVGLHHSIAGSIEILMALFAGAGPMTADFGKFILWAVLGNAVGGSCFVALLKFGHVRAGAASYPSRPSARRRKRIGA
jgi:formate/nitrite transporter FocA (FNT family)